MGLDTKTYWLADRQSQCDFDFDFDFDLLGLELRESPELAVGRIIKKKWQEKN
jgi:hypothetical protein